MTNEVKFRVSGGELSNYFKSIQKDSENLANTNIKSALDQVKYGNQQLGILKSINAETERKIKLEAEAARAILQQKRNDAIAPIEEKRKKNIDFLESKRGKEGYTDEYIETRIKKSNQQADDAIKKVDSDYKETLRSQKEQEKQSKLQVLLQRESIETQKRKAEENVRAINNGNLRLSDVLNGAKTDEEKLVANLTKQGVERAKREELRDKQPSILGSLITIDSVNKLASTVTQLAQTNNGFDAVQATASTAGRIIGGALGALVGSFFGGVGAVAGAGVGSQLGGELAGDVGAMEQKEGLLRQEYLKTRYKYNAITGADRNKDFSEDDFSSVGVNGTQYLSLRSEMAKRRGYDDAKTTKDAIYAERGFGIDPNTSALLIELQRSGKENSRDLANTIGAIIERGRGNIFKNGDTSFANELLSKYTSLAKEILKTNTTVGSSLAFDAIRQFNSMGGMWDARDTRSGGLINSLNNDLSHPSSESGRALSFALLRRQHPNAGIFDLHEMMQGGMGTASYLKGTMELIDQLGGDDQQRMMNLSGRFPSIPYSAIRTLYRHRKDLRNFDQSELKAVGLNADIFKKKAEGNTADIDRISAENYNRTLAGMPYDAALKAITDAVKSNLSGGVIELYNGRITFKGSTGVMKANNVHKAQLDQKAKQTADMNDALMNSMQ